MAAKKKGLGRGLDALLSKSPATAGETPLDPIASHNQDGQLAHLSIELIQPGKYQPRRDIQPEALEELAQSIQAQGLLQPIVVRPIDAGHYEIIAGERRWRASQKAGLTEIPAIVRNVADEAAMAMALIENIQREDLNPIEEAAALQRLIEEFQLTQQQVAQAVGKSRATVTNLLRLMSLSPKVKIQLEQGQLEMGHARALLSLPEAKQVEAAQKTISNALTVRQTEALVRALQADAMDSKETPANKTDPDIQRLEKSLGEKMGAQVSINHGAKGKGKLVIRYNSLDELDGILGHIV